MIKQKMSELQTRVLHFDTDSVIFTINYKPADWTPALGDHLGESTNELDDDDYNTNFVPGGPKNYAYKTKNGKTTCKVRIFTLNFRRSQKLIFSILSERVCSPNQLPIFLDNPHFIKQDAKTKTTHTVNLQKKHKVVYDMRVVPPSCGRNRQSMATMGATSQSSVILSASLPA